MPPMTSRPVRRLLLVNLPAKMLVPCCRSRDYLGQGNRAAAGQLAGPWPSQDPDAVTFIIEVVHRPSTSKVPDGTLVALLMDSGPRQDERSRPGQFKGPLPVMLPERVRLVPALVKTEALLARTRFAEMLLFVPPRRRWRTAAAPPLVALSVMVPPPLGDRVARPARWRRTGH